MGSKPKVKPYQPSAEELELQRSQLEAMREKDSEIEEQRYRRQTGAKKRSLLSHVAPKQQKQALGE